MRNSILRRTFRYFLVSLCAIILVFSAFVLSYLNNQYKDQFVSSQLYVAEKTAESMEELLLNIKQSVYYLCCNEALADALIGLDGQELANQRTRIAEAFIMNIGTPAAAMMQSSYEMLFVDEQYPFAAEQYGFKMNMQNRQRVYSALEVKDEPWFRAAQEKTAQVYAFINPAAREYIMFGHWLRNAYIKDPRYSGDVGLLLYAMPVRSLNAILTNDQMAEGSVSLLLFNDQVLSSTDESIFPVDGTDDLEQLMQRLPGKNEISSAVFGGIAYSLCSSVVSSGWRVIVLTPTATMWQSMRSMLPMLSTFVLVLVIVALIISVMFSRRLAAPIRKLSDAMIRARKAQELPQKISVPKSDDEIEYLYNSYNDIVDNIHRISELERAQNAKLQKSELKALQSQINPHFVYNTLDSVACIALLNGEEDIATMVASLINILKYSIRFSSMQVRLQEEIDYLKQYIQIQNLRYRERFRFVCEVPEEYNDVKVPRLLIQPLVENALFHAENEELLEIRVYCEVVNGQFLIHVSDNGSDADVAQLNERLHANPTGDKYGIGIVNVNKRIQLTAGEEFGLRYEQLPSGGLDAIVVLPYTKTD